VVATEPGTRSLARNMMLEAQTIGKNFGANFRVDVERRIDGAAGVGAHRTSMLQDVDKGRAIGTGCTFDFGAGNGPAFKCCTPFIDSVLALAQQMGRVKGLYPTFPEVVAIKPAMAS
jgi:2-dehydropantoate 2-reductase